MGKTNGIVDSNQQWDYSLITRIRLGDEEAKETLVLKYIPMVKHIVRNYYASFLDFDDLLQEGIIGLLHAIDEYRPDLYDVKFSSFAYICIIRKIYNVIKH
ncbi:MAG: sigma-70 family RNA polymerase sigma factor, partial [Limnochordia bacterium]